MRRQFELPEGDHAYLDSLGLSWEAILEANVRWVTIHNRSVPLGYNLTNVATGLIIPASYPDVEIDMVYFFPSLVRADGKAIACLSGHTFDGKTWQRWSRHRTGNENAWRPELDDLAGHLTLVDHWLSREFGGGPP